MTLLEDIPSALRQIAPQCRAHLSGQPVIQVQCCHGLQHPHLDLSTHPQPSQVPQQWPVVDNFFEGLQQHQVGLCLKAQKQIVKECCWVIAPMEGGSCTAWPPCLVNVTPCLCLYGLET